MPHRGPRAYLWSKRVPDAPGCPPAAAAGSAARRTAFVLSLLHSAACQTSRVGTVSVRNASTPSAYDPRGVDDSNTTTTASLYSLSTNASRPPANQVIVDPVTPPSNASADGTGSSARAPSNTTGLKILGTPQDGTQTPTEDAAEGLGSESGDGFIESLPWWAWVVAGIGLVLLIATIALARREKRITSCVQTTELISETRRVEHEMRILDDFPAPAQRQPSATTAPRQRSTPLLPHHDHHEIMIPSVSIDTAPLFLDRLRTTSTFANTANTKMLDGTDLTCRTSFTNSLAAPPPGSRSTPGRLCL